MAKTPGPEARDKFDMTENVQTWEMFLRLAKWVVIGAVIMLVGMALFLTGAEPPQ